MKTLKFIGGDATIIFQTTKGSLQNDPNHLGQQIFVNNAYTFVGSIPVQINDDADAVELLLNNIIQEVTQ